MHEALENDRVRLGQLVVVDAVDDGEVDAVRRRRDQHALGAGRKVERRLLLRREDAGALERDVDAELFPRQLRRVLDGGHFDCAVAAIDRVALDRHLAGEAAMHGVVAQQMRIGLDRGEIVHGDDLDILAPSLDHGAQDIAADAAEAVDGYANRHAFLVIGAKLAAVRAVGVGWRPIPAGMGWPGCLGQPVLSRGNPRTQF